MAYEQRDNSGSLFKNDRKEKASHPDYNGSIMIDGREYWLSAWIKQGKRGSFMSMAAKPKDGALSQQQSISQQAMPKGRDPISTGRDSDIPF